MDDVKKDITDSYAFESAEVEKLKAKRNLYLKEIKISDDRLKRFENYDFSDLSIGFKKGQMLGIVSGITAYYLTSNVCVSMSTFGIVLFASTFEFLARDLWKVSSYSNKAESINVEIEEKKNFVKKLGQRLNN